MLSVSSNGLGFLHVAPVLLLLSFSYHHYLSPSIDTRTPFRTTPQPSGSFTVSIDWNPSRSPSFDAAESMNFGIKNVPHVRRRAFTQSISSSYPISCRRREGEPVDGDVPPTLLNKTKMPQLANNDTPLKQVGVAAGKGGEWRSHYQTKHDFVTILYFST